MIRYRTEMPDYSSLGDVTYDWEKSTYGKVSEDLPHNLITPLGKPVLLTTYVEANLMHDVMNGKSVTGILHFFSKTPIEWFTRKETSV